MRNASVAIACELDRQAGLNARLRAEKYSGVKVTLNGEPAKIVGFAMRFATIATLDPRGAHFEWSWDAVNRIVENGGAFCS